MNQFRKEMRDDAAPCVRIIEVGEEDAGQRLDNFLLRHCKGVPKSHVYRIVRSGEVRLNGKRADVSDRIADGDKVRIPPIRLPAATPESETAVLRGKAAHVDLPVLFEDDALLVINKPSGIAVHGGSGIDLGVIETLRLQRPEARFLELAHRLDRETSGILLIGKKRSALKVLHDMFRQGTADKRYLALVVGDWAEKLKDVRLPLTRFLTEEGERRVCVDHEDGMFAHTIFRRKGGNAGFTLLEAQLKTGRTHQIRVHLAHSGHPIAGDEKYGDFALNKSLQRDGLKRMFLHAAAMRFAHPVTQAALHLHAPLPAALQGFLKQAGIATPSPATPNGTKTA